jgi:hypothetical protein
VPLKSLEYWVLAQLILDLGLFLLVIFFVWKLRALGCLLHPSHPAGANLVAEIAGVSQKLAALEQRVATWGGQPSAEMPGLAQQITRGDAQDREPPSFPPQIDSGKSLRAQVADLAGRGLSPEEIARQLRLQLAEVRVAMDLSRLLAK